MPVLGAEGQHRKEREMKYTFRIQTFYTDETYKVGDKVLVLHYCNESNHSDEEWYGISKRYAEDGYPGNMDHTVKRFHGWRGTYNNISTNACGVYEIKKVEKLDNWGDKIKVTIGRKDLKKGEA